MNQKEYWLKQAEAMRGLTPEEQAKLQGDAARAIPQEEQKRKQMEAVVRGDYENLYPFPPEPKEK